MHDAALESLLHREAGVAEDVEHPAVRRLDVRVEDADALPPRMDRQPLEQPRADALPVQLVGDDERDLGTAVVRRFGVEAGVRDQPARALADQRHAGARRRGDEMPRRFLVQRARAEEALMLALRREARDEAEYRVGVIGPGPAQGDRRAILQDDVAVDVRRCWPHEMPLAPSALHESHRGLASGPQPERNPRRGLNWVKCHGAGKFAAAPGMAGRSRARRRLRRERGRGRAGGENPGRTLKNSSAVRATQRIGPVNAGHFALREVGTVDATGRSD